MMKERFAERVLTPQSEEENGMIYREFNGMEAVARFDEENESDEGGENDE